MLNIAPVLCGWIVFILENPPFQRWKIQKHGGHLKMLVDYGGHGSPVSTMSVALERSTWVHPWHWIIYDKYPKTWQGLRYFATAHGLHVFMVFVPSKHLKTIGDKQQ